MKKIIINRISFVMSLIIMVMVFSPNFIFAQDLNSLIESIPIESLETLPIEKTYSASEILKDMERSGLKKEELENFKKNHQDNLNNLNLQENTQLNSINRSTIRYSLFTLDGIKFKKSLRNYHLQPQVLAGLEYNNNPEPSRIVSLESPYVYTGNGAPASFVGNMTYKLISGREFYTLIQGKAYKDGRMKVSGGVQVGIGKSVTANINVEGGNGLLRDISYQESYYSQSLNK